MDQIEKLQKKIDLLIEENTRLWERVKELRRVEPYDGKTEPQRSVKEGLANAQKDESGTERT